MQEDTKFYWLMEKRILFRIAHQAIIFVVNLRPIVFKVNDINAPEEGSFRLLEDGSFRLLEDGSFRLLE